MNILIHRTLTRLSQGDRWYSPVRVLPPEGEFNIIVKNTPDGPLAEILESIRDKNYDPVRTVFRSPTEEEISASKNDPLNQAGFGWVGFSKRYMEREFRYMKWEEGRDEHGQPKMMLVEKIRGTWENGKPPSFYYSTEITVLVEGAEILVEGTGEEGNTSIDALVDLTVVTESPYLAYFQQGSWISKVTLAVQAAFREHVSDKTFEKVREEKARGAEGLVAKLKALSGGDPETDKDGLRGVCGSVISNVQFVKFDVAGSEEMKRASEAVAIATRRAQAKRITAAADRNADIERAKGERDRMEALASQGNTAAIAQAMRDVKPGATVVLGGGVMPSIPVGHAHKEKNEEGENEEK